MSGGLHGYEGAWTLSRPATGGVQQLGATVRVRDRALAESPALAQLMAAERLGQAPAARLKHLALLPAQPTAVYPATSGTVQQRRGREMCIVA